MDKRSNPPTALGFLTVVEDSDLGLVGGYLVLNAAGRPLEFHCTAPIRSSRAQQILYGPTLTPYLYGEQIAATLIAKGAANVLAVLTDQLAVLAARSLVEIPMGALLTEGNPSGGSSPLPESLEGIARRLSFSPRHLSDGPELTRRLTELGDLFDLTEPFDRIREAIREAQRDAKSRVEAA
jgi:hypothetical protein